MMRTVFFHKCFHLHPELVHQEFKIDHGFHYLDQESITCFLSLPQVDPASMNIAFIRFYEELNDFLPPDKRKALYSVHFPGDPAVKQVIEAEGVPHTEIDLILINGISVPLTEKVHSNDRISVYPVFESFDISPVNTIRLKPLREPKFVLDVHLGRLARYLRMLGFDSLYNNAYPDHEIVRISLEEERTILTRNRKLLMLKVIERGAWIRNEMVTGQVIEVIRRLDLVNAIRLFSRCTLCNGTLEPSDEISVKLLFPGYRWLPGTLFYRCPRCRHIYWNGTHCERFTTWIRSNLSEPG